MVTMVRGILQEWQYMDVSQPWASLPKILFRITPPFPGPLPTPRSLWEFLRFPHNFRSTSWSFVWGKPVSFAVTQQMADHRLQLLPLPRGRILRRSCLTSTLTNYKNHHSVAQSANRLAPADETLEGMEAKDSHPDPSQQALGNVPSFFSFIPPFSDFIPFFSFC